VRRFLLSAFLAFTLLAVVAQCGLTSPDFSFSAARDDCGFNKPDPEGAFRYGYTLYPSSGSRTPDFRNWCKLVAQGKTRIWNDANGNKVKDAGEVRDCNYYIWYTLEIYTQCDNFRPAWTSADGKVESEIQNMRKIYADNGLQPVSVGDAAGARDGGCRFLRGPYSAQITVRAEMQAETSEYSISDKTYIPPGFEDSAAIAEECNKACQGRTDEAVRVAREMCERWEQSYRLALSLARDVRPFILRAADVPKDLSVNVDLPSKDEPSTYALVYYKQPDGQFYGLELGASVVDTSVSYNGALAQAKERFKKEAGTLKKAEPFALPGADEAVRMLYRNTGSNTEYIIFRVNNTWGRVWGAIRGKTLAPTRAATLAKAVCAKMAGAPSTPPDATEAASEALDLKAEPASAWADGASKVKLVLTAKDTAGKPLAGASFSIDLESNLLGKCDDVKMITDASGKAVSVYAPVKAGVNTITVSGEAGSASVKVGQGGLLIAQDGSSKTSVLADGKSKTALKVTCVSPSGQPVSGVKVAAAIEGKGAGSGGTLEPASSVTGADGAAKFFYTAPQLDPTAGDRATDVYVTASASAGNPARLIKTAERISLYAGECVYLKVAKLGFETIEKQPVAVQARNGTVTGIAVVGGDGGGVPVNAATVTVSGLDGRQIAEAATGMDGRFDIKFVTDPTSPADSRNEVPKPLELTLSKDLANRVVECRSDLEDLQAGGYDVSSAVKFTDGFVEALAKSAPAGVSQGSAQSASQVAAPAPEQQKKKKGLLGALDKLNDGLDKLQKSLNTDSGSRASSGAVTTDYLVNAYPRMAWACRYAKLLNQRQCESADWLSENIKGGLGSAMDVFGITDKIHDAAKSKLGEKFAGTEWEKYRENVLADFVEIMYGQFQKAVDMAKTMNYDPGDLENYKKFGVDWTAKKTVEGITEGVKLTLQKLSHNRTQEMLTKAGGAAVRGELSSSDHTSDSGKALELFTAFENEHNKQNIANCNTEQYRLATKLFIDTAVKGPLMYLNLKKVAMDADAMEKIASLDTASLEDLQDKFIKNGDLASRMGGAVDSMFQGYQGYNWIVDYCRANTAGDALTKLLVR